MLDRRYRYLLLQARAAIAAARAVYLNHAFESFVRKLGAPDSSHAAGDLQHVARPRTHAQQVGRCQSRNRVADVFDPRLRNPEGKRSRRR